MRTLFLGIDAFSRVGGLQKFNQRLVRTLLERHPAAGALMLRDDAADLPPDLAPPDLAPRITACGGRGGAFFRAALAAARRTDILLVGHINLIPVAWAMKRIAPRLKVLLFVHGVEVWNAPGYRQMRRWDRRALRAVDRIAAVSAHTADRMAAAYGVERTRFTVFPNTVDPPEGAVTPALDAPHLLAVTRMGPRDHGKNLDKLLAAFARIAPDRPGARLDIVGDGVLRPEIEAEARRLGLEGRAVFHGRVDDATLARLYAAARAFVLPSDKEGFGIVYLEAWTHGLPVICGAGGAAHEVVTDGRDGFVTEATDIALMADKMARLLDDTDLARAMGQAGLDKVRSRYSTACLGRNLDALLRDMG